MTYLSQKSDTTLTHLDVAAIIYRKGSNAGAVYEKRTAHRLLYFLVPCQSAGLMGQSYSHLERLPKYFIKPVSKI